MTKQNVFPVESVWLQLREIIFGDDFDGGGFCGTWTRQASEMLNGLGIEHKIMGFGPVLGKENNPLYPTTGHRWIVVPDYGKVSMYIADGTAGQFFEKDLLNGFYGKLQDAPDRLKEAYQMGKII